MRDFARMDEKKIKHAKKILFFSLFSRKKNKVFVQKSLMFLNGVENLSFKKIFIFYIG